MTDRSTWIAGKKQSDRLREKLSTPEGHMQDCLERTLPQSVVADAQKREMWIVHPDVAASSAVFDSVLALVQTLFLSIGDKAGAKSFGTWFQGGTSAPQELDAWCWELVRKATKSFNFADKFRAEVQSGIESEAEELYLRFVRSSRQCVFRIGDINSEEKPVFSAAMRAVIGTLPESTPELWDLAIKKAAPKPLTPEEREYIRRSPRGDSIMQDRADETMAVLGFCKYMCGDYGTCSRSDELLALCAIGHAFHTSRCAGKSLPEEMQPGFRLFKRLLALRKELIRIASAASGWHWLFSKNPDMPRYEVRRVMHEAWQSGVYPRGKLNLPWEVWDNDIIDMASMDSYPQAMPDDLFILSADGGKLALWEALE